MNTTLLIKSKSTLCITAEHHYNGTIYNHNLAFGRSITWVSLLGSKIISEQQCMACCRGKGHCSHSGRPTRGRRRHLPRPRRLAFTGLVRRSKPSNPHTSKQASKAAKNVVNGPNLNPKRSASSLSKWGRRAEASRPTYRPTDCTNRGQRAVHAQAPHGTLAATFACLSPSFFFARSFLTFFSVT